MLDFKSGTTDAQVASVGAAMESLLRLDGVLELSWGKDLGLRPGNMAYVAVFDIRDEEAYRAFDTNAGHQALRRDFAPVIARAERCQFLVRP